ncbi:hypothetical protein CEXT_551961 [Caerostris extrusa]|uniref:Uncharacterized protein n=1 Tax=Caerostris extrusa TaxID=172846 RepID=A0AAV4U0Z0_CAEEX|nr:hypothetical protein CEXT_551961 [Caerostris extrusa]
MSERKTLFRSRTLEKRGVSRDFYSFCSLGLRDVVCLFLQGPPLEASVPSLDLFEMSKNELSSLLCKRFILYCKT